MQILLRTCSFFAHSSGGCQRGGIALIAADRSSVLQSCCDNTAVCNRLKQHCSKWIVLHIHTRVIGISMTLCGMSLFSASRRLFHLFFVTLESVSIASCFRYVCCMSSHTICSFLRAACDREAAACANPLLCMGGRWEVSRSFVVVAVCYAPDVGSGVSRCPVQYSARRTTLSQISVKT